MVLSGLSVTLGIEVLGANYLLCGGIYMLSFNNEMLIPKINGEIYFAIYEVENWLRRICLTAYMLEYGGNWYDKIPEKMYKKLETTLQMRSSRKM
jgi:hypothetical protein